jgi:endonuclease-3
MVDGPPPDLAPGELTSRQQQLIPMRESLRDKRERTTQILARLNETYPDAHCELNFSTPLELLIATILSARCTDKQVNRVTESLFKKYPHAAAFAQADQTTLEQDLKSLGFFRNKSKSIRACCQKLVERHGGNVPGTMAELIQLDGVGRKTANVVLGNAFNCNEGIVVDTHVARLSLRLGLTTQKDPEKIEQDLLKLATQTQWTMFSHWLIWHGRRRCFARKPDCPQCEILSLCPTGEQNGKAHAGPKSAHA